MWRVEFTASARRSLLRLDAKVREQILRFLRERVATAADPRSLGLPLKGRRFAGLWRYRSGDWRILCEIQDGALLVLVVDVGHRREVYR
jgi:mRNA interferase RelE/StbE